MAMYYFPLSSYCFYAPFQCFTPSSQICTIIEPSTSESMKSTPETPQIPSLPLRPTFSEAVINESSSLRARAVSKSQRQKTICMDQDYRPDCSSGKRKTKMKQIENRNIIPNVIRLIISFIQKKGKSEKILERLFSKLHGKSGWNIKRFYHYQGMLRTHLNNYVNEETLGMLVRVHAEVLDIYDEEEQRFYNQLSRILINEFIRDDFASYVLTSKRMDKSKKNHHLGALRNIKNRIRLLLAGHPSSPL